MIINYSYINGYQIIDAQTIFSNVGVVPVSVISAGVFFKSDNVTYTNNIVG